MIEELKRLEKETSELLREIAGISKDVESMEKMLQETVAELAAIKREYEIQREQHPWMIEH